MVFGVVALGSARGEGHVDDGRVVDVGGRERTHRPGSADKIEAICLRDIPPFNFFLLLWSMVQQERDIETTTEVHTGRRKLWQEVC